MKIALTALTALLLTAGTAPPPPRPVSRVVTIKGMQFSPARISANVGDTIVWRNNDAFSHTATSKGVFDTHEMKPKAMGTWVVKKRGVINYACLFHATMKGIIDVK